jgi:hypothetical protein
VIQQSGLLCSRNNPNSANDDYGDVSIDADTTVKLAAGLVIPDKVAVIRELPAPMPVAKPSVDIVATALSELVHFTWSVMFWLWLSNNVPRAMYCREAPIDKVLPGVEVIEIEVS